MAQHPYWSGQLRISLVSLGVNVFTATRRGSQIPLRELDRETGERIHHRNVNDDGKFVEDEDIVKGYEYEKDEYVQLEKEEIDELKLPSSDTLELTQFVDMDAIPPIYFERPYFVMPAGKSDAEIYAVLNESLTENKKAGIGQIALRGREELCAILPLNNGLILETLRYAGELLDPDDFFSDLAKPKIKRDAIDLASQLVKKNAAPLHIEKFHDHYHEALLELIEAKQHHRKPRVHKAEAKPAKVIDFMDALQKSLKTGATTKARSHANHSRKRKAG